MCTDLSKVGIRRIGILVCFNQYHLQHNRYPKDADELLEVTSTVLTPASFKKYSDWFSGYAQCNT